MIKHSVLSGSIYWLANTVIRIVLTYNVSEYVDPIQLEGSEMSNHFLKMNDGMGGHSS